ncbi:hypothetical protein HDV63DRAFT_410448 [Trichoderma sp. SZMC 28014]
MSADGDINTSSNIIPLKKDLHKCFDDRWFAVVPKRTSSGTRHVTHIFSTEATEIWPSFHNIKLRCLSQELGREFLFARFAWAVIQQVKPFIIAGDPHKVIRITTNNSNKTEYLATDIGGLELRNLYGGGSTSLKRKFPSATGDGEQISSHIDPDECLDDFLSATEQQMLPVDVRKELESSAADFIASQNLGDVNE